MAETLKLSIDRKTQLGRGATATIYRAIDDGEECAAKIYNQETPVNKAKINAMLSNVPANVTIEIAGKTYPQLAWPTALLESNGTPTGYLMPLVDLNDSFPLDYYYDQVLFKKLKAPDEAALSYKLEIAKNLSLIVAELHNHGHYFIDLKPQNIRVFRRTHIVTLLDCDGFSIKSHTNKRYPAELISTDYISPEAYRENTPPQELGENQDRYALAVIIFQLLNQGTHPFQGILKDATGATTNDEKAASGLYPHGLVVDARIAPRPQSTHALWLESTRKLFDQAFIGSRTTRPSATEWAEHFDQLLVDKALVRCDKAPTNVAHMRFKRRKCPACYLSELPKINVAPTQSTVPNKHAEIVRGNSTANQSHPTPSNTDYGYLPWIIGAIVLFLMFSIFNKAPAPAELAPTELAPTELAPAAEVAAPAEPIAETAPTEVPDAQVKAEWTLVSNGDNVIVYADLSTIHQTGSTVQMMVMVDSKTVQEVKGAKFSSVLSQVEIDCESKTRRFLAGTSYSGNMAGGAKVNEYPPDADASSFSPNTLMESVWKIACGKS